MGIHHITAITNDPQKNINFYEGFLGQRLVKRTVNYDDPSAYHFYFGDYSGTPGTLLTFFYFGQIQKRESGVGEANKISYSVSEGAYDFWIKRANEFRIETKLESSVFGHKTIQFMDPDGMLIELAVDQADRLVNPWQDFDIKPSNCLNGFSHVTLSVASVSLIEAALKLLGYKLESRVERSYRYVSTDGLASKIVVEENKTDSSSVQGYGSVHHIAFKTLNDELELKLRRELINHNFLPTQVIDRKYFHSVYFQTSARILFEIATDGPGFAIDEPVETLGEKLVLPEHLEPNRQMIVANLPSISLPRNS